MIVKEMNFKIQMHFYKYWVIHFKGVETSPNHVKEGKKPNLDVHEVVFLQCVRLLRFIVSKSQWFLLKQC